MATPREIIQKVASLQNDTAQSVYTNEACLPYLNISLKELQEIFEQNNIPSSNKTSATFTVPASTNIIEIDFTSTPALPPNLIEIQQIWESFAGQEQWIPMTRKEFIPKYLVNPPINQFVIWAWIDQKVVLPPCNQSNDIKLDYIKYLFNEITIDDIDTDLAVINSETYLFFNTAGLCSMFIGENETRAAALQGKAEEAIARTLGISNKGRQAINTRRRPFRSSYKRLQLW